MDLMLILAGLALLVGIVITAQFFFYIAIFAACLLLGNLLHYVLMFVIDTDVLLFFAEKFGKPVDSLKGQVVWVTGASTGIGEGLAVELAKNGVRLVLSARRESKLLQVKQKCLDEGKSLKDDDILVLPMDVTVFDKHQECFDKVIRHFGKLDILVNNAGRSQRANWEDIDINVDREMFELNVFAVISLSRIALRYFVKEKHGHLVVMSSLAGVVGAPYSASYTGSKHALHGYFEALRLERFNMKNFNITLLCPGPVFSDILQESFTESPGEKFGSPMLPTDKRMSTERCAHLSAVAIANKLKGGWISIAPILPFAYAGVFYPTIASMIFWIAGQRRVVQLRDTRWVMKEN